MEDKIPTITFTDLETGQTEELYVLEETVLAGRKYLLLTEDPAGDADAFIFREEGEDADDLTCCPVEDEDEYQAIARLFEELMDDTEFIRE